MFPTSRTRNRAVRQGAWKRLGQPNHAVARTAQRRVQAQDGLLDSGAGHDGRAEDRGWGAARTAETVLHLLKLPGRDAHRKQSASDRTMTKDEKGLPGDEQSGWSDRIRSLEGDHREFFPDEEWESEWEAGAEGAETAGAACAECDSIAGVECVGGGV